MRCACQRCGVEGDHEWLTFVTKNSKKTVNLCAECMALVRKLMTDFINRRPV